MTSDLHNKSYRQLFQIKLIENVISAINWAKIIVETVGELIHKKLFKLCQERDPSFTFSRLIFSQIPVTDTQLCQCCTSYTDFTLKQSEADHDLNSPSDNADGDDALDRKDKKSEINSIDYKLCWSGDGGHWLQNVATCDKFIKVKNFPLGCDQKVPFFTRWSNLKYCCSSAAASQQHNPLATLWRDTERGTRMSDMEKVSWKVLFFKEKLFCWEISRRLKSVVLSLFIFIFELGNFCVWKSNFVACEKSVALRKL